MRRSRDARKRIVSFVLLTFGLSSFFYVHFAATGGLEGPRAQAYVLGLMWCPGVAALVTVLVHGGRLAELGWRWGRTRYQLAAYLLPLGYAALVYLPVWLFASAGIRSEVLEAVARRFGLEGWPSALVAVAFFALAAGLGTIPGVVFALGEEIGWRGFLLPALAERMGFTRAALASGLLWAVWHYPLVLFAGYAGAGPRWFSLVCFTVMLVGIGVPLAWLRLRSASLWTAALFHASHNLFVQSVFDRLTPRTPATAWITGEFGAGLAGAAVLVGYLFWRKRDELPPVAGA